MSKKSKVPFRKGRSVCIFCGGTPTTKEHIWPQWSHSVLPRSEGHGRFILTGHRKRNTLRTRKHYNRQGSVLTYRVKRVCGACNSGWMSGYENAVRPYLERMMVGKRTFLNSQRQEALARYLAYKVLVLDFGDDEPASKLEVSNAFHKSGAMPPGLLIYLFNCWEGEWRAALRTYFIGLAPEDRFLGPDMPKNVKSFAVGFGNLFVFAVLTPPEFDLNIEFDTPAAVRLWPIRDSQIVWPPRYSISSDQAEFIASTLSRVDDEPNVKRVD